MDCENIISKRCKTAIGIAVFVRILLQMFVPLYVLADYVNDDQLYVSYAQSLIGGAWLGSYSHTTLNKMPGFSFYLAFCKMFNIPYMMGIGLLYSLISCIFFIAINRLLKNNKMSYVCFLYILFSPVMFDDFVVQRIHRNSLLAPLTLLVVSSYLLFYYDRKKGCKKLIIWGGLAGVGLAGFLVSVENTTWLVCFVFGATVLLAGLYIVENFKEIEFGRAIRYFVCLAIPIILGLAGTNLLKTVNYIKYGVYAANDWNETYFAEMGKAMIKIDYGEDVPGVYVNRETINKLYEVSPNFANLQSYLDNAYDSGVAFAYKDGEIQRDFIMWYIRWAADSIGVYEDAASADEYYKQIYFDIEEAFENGELEKKDGIVLSNLCGPLVFDELPEIFRYLFLGGKELITYQDINTVEEAVIGSDINAVRMADMVSTAAPTSGNFVYRDGYITRLSNLRIRILNMLIKIFQLTGGVLAFFALISYFWELVRNIYYKIMRKTTRFSFWLIETGMLLTIFASLFSVSLIYYEVMPDEFREYYAAGAYPVWQMFICLSLGTAVLNIKNMFDKRKGNEKNEVNNTNTMLQ